MEDKFHTDRNAPWRLSGDAINTNTCILPRRHSADVACHMCFVVLITVKVTSQRKCIIKQWYQFQDHLLLKKEPTHAMLEASKASDLKDSSTHGKPDAWLLEVLYAHTHAKKLVQTTDC